MGSLRIFDTTKQVERYDLLMALLISIIWPIKDTLGKQLQKQQKKNISQALSFNSIWSKKKQTKKNILLNG